MLPDLIDPGPPCPWPVLPPGTHLATFAEVAARFATNPRRQELFDGLCAAAAALAKAGCRRLYLDGSFVTGKPHPEDFDCCWDVAGVDAKLLDPVLLDFSDGRAAQKRRFGGELFVSALPGAHESTFLQFFQVEKSSGVPKGIVELALGAPPRESRP